MAQQFDLLNWQFNFSDRGTYAGAYFDKLNLLVSGYNISISAVNAQLLAAEDSAAIKAAIEDIRDLDITDLLNQCISLRNESITIRDATNAIGVGEINGLDVDFNSVKVQGVNVVPQSRTINGKPLSSNITLSKADVVLDQADNTSDEDKPISTATQAALDALQVQINRNRVIAFAGAVL